MLKGLINSLGTKILMDNRICTTYFLHNTIRVKVNSDVSGGSFCVQRRLFRVTGFKNKYLTH